jgi:hypothetical protein
VLQRLVPHMIIIIPTLICAHICENQQMGEASKENMHFLSYAWKLPPGNK